MRPLFPSQIKNILQIRQNISARSFFVILLLILNTRGQTIFDEPLSPRIANYEIKISLDPETKVISGNEIIHWKNPTDNPVSELQFHLYMNAFRSSRSTFLRDYLKSDRRRKRFDETKTGGIVITKMVMGSGAILTDSIRYIRPDDGNLHDSTVVSVSLPAQILPGKEIDVEIDFETTLPAMIARTGYAYDYFMLGQWFPKIGVLENGGWNCHQFHASSEFFADFGTYDVEFTLPGNFIVGASGVLLDKTVNDSLQTLTYRAEDVHDFALTAWPEYQKMVREIEGIQVSLLFAPEHSGQVERYFKSISLAIHYLNDRLLPYPYPNLTIVDPPIYAHAAAGMEYPCLICAGSIWGTPETIRIFPEDVTVHEYAHQYFYGILASNEFEEPWLDEGFTSFATHKILDSYYGLHSSRVDFGGLEIGNFDQYRSGYTRRPDQSIVVKPAWEFERGGYGRFAYDKPVLILQTLENYLGTDTMKEIFKRYIYRWKFRHPITRDFINVANEIAPENMDWYFDQALFSTAVLDYEVVNISNRNMASDGTESGYESRVEIKRNGDFTFPVEIGIRFANGDSLTENWNGMERFKTLNISTESRIISASVDPRQKVLLDVNWSNNSCTFKENKIAFWRHWLKLMQLYQGFLSQALTF